MSKEGMTYRLWVNESRTLLVRQWPTGVVEVAERDDPGMTWGPPSSLVEEEIPGEAWVPSGLSQETVAEIVRERQDALRRVAALEAAIQSFLGQHDGAEKLADALADILAGEDPP